MSLNCFKRFLSSNLYALLHLQNKNVVVVGFKKQFILNREHSERKIPGIGK